MFVRHDHRQRRSRGQSLPVRERVALGRRPAAAVRRCEDLDGPAGLLDRLLGGGGEGVGLDPDAPWSISPLARTFTRAPVLTSPALARVSGVATSPVEGLQGVEVHRGVLDAERVGEPLQLRDALHERELATLEAGRDRVAGALALHATAGGLAALAADAAGDPALGAGALRERGADRAVSSYGSSGGSSAWPWPARLAQAPCSGPALDVCLLRRGRPDLDEVWNPGDHPADLGAVGENALAPDSPQPEGPERRPVLGLGADGGAYLGDEQVGLTGRRLASRSTSSPSRLFRFWAGLICRLGSVEQVSGSLALAVGAEHAGRRHLVGGLAPQAGHLFGSPERLEPGDRGVGDVDPVGRPERLAEDVVDAGHLEDRRARHRLRSPRYRERRA